MTTGDSGPAIRITDSGWRFTWPEAADVTVTRATDKLGRVRVEVTNAAGVILKSGMANPNEDWDWELLGKRAGGRNGASQDVWAGRLLNVAARIRADVPGIGLVGQRGPGAMQGRRLGDIPVKQVGWLWRPNIPVGKVTLLAGDPGIGKSWALFDIAARVTVGGYTPDNTALMPQGMVVILNAEDDAGDTIRPRIEAQNGNSDYVYLAETVRMVDGTERLPNLLEDLAALEEVILKQQAVLVIIDPANAYMGRTEGNSDIAVRQVLSPLKLLAERTGAAVVCVMHLNKGMNTNALYRVLGSIGYVGAARSVLAIGESPGDPDTRILAPAKANLARKGGSISFTITGEPALAWGEAVSLTANQLFAPRVEGEAEERDAVEEARVFLVQVLTDGPQIGNDVLRQAKEQGISQRTLERARQAEGVTRARGNVYRQGQDGPWYWRLPNAQDDTPRTEGGRRLRF